MNSTCRIILAGCLVVSAGLSGCAAVAWMAAQFAPPQKVNALYKPPKGKTILVFVDDVRGEVAYEPVKGELTDRLNSKLTKYKIAAATVPYDKVTALAAATRGFADLTVGEIGEKLGAELVLYVHLDKFSVRDEEQGPLWRGRLAATIRMVDVKAGRLWPLDEPEGHAITPVETQTVENPPATYAVDLAKQLAEQASEQIVNCFRDNYVKAEGTAQ